MHHELYCISWSCFLSFLCNPYIPFLIYVIFIYLFPLIFLLLLAVTVIEGDNNFLFFTSIIMIIIIIKMNLEAE